MGVRVVVFRMSGLRNREGDAEFEALKAASLNGIQARLALVPVEEDAVLAGFRELHSKLGFSNRRYPAAPQSLLENLARNGSMARVNLLVDIYNLVSAETRLSLGGHDLAKVAGSVQLRITTGAEVFQPLGAVEPRPVRPGAYAYIDDEEVICLLEVKQVEKTRLSLDTREGLWIVQGNPATTQAQLQAAAERLIQLIQRFCGGQEHLFVQVG